MAAPALPDAKPAVPPQIALPPEIVLPVERLAKSIEGAETAIQHLNQLEDELSRLRTSVESILGDATQTAEGLRPKLAEVRSQIEKLGAVPASGQMAEAPAIVAERQRLNTIAAQLDGAIKTTELTWVRARQLIEKITVMRHAIFTRNLLERLNSPLLPALWRDVASDSPAVGRRIRYLTDDWWGWAQKESGWLAALALAVLAVYAGLAMLVRRLIGFGMKRFDAGERASGRVTMPGAAEHGTATFFERAVAVGWIAPARIVPGAAAALMIFGALDTLDLLFPPWERLGAALLKAVLAFIAIASLIDAALAPKYPGWRLVPISTHSARRIDMILKAIVLIFAVDFALTEMSRAFFIPLALSVVQSFLMSVSFALLMQALAWTPIEVVTHEAAPAAAVPGAGVPVPLHDGSAVRRLAPRRMTPRWLKVPLWVLAIAIIAASLLGYVSLGRFMARQLVLTGMVLAVTGLLILAIRSVTRAHGDRRFVMGSVLESRFGLDQPRQKQLTRLAEMVLTTALMLAALPVLLLQWGFASADIRDWLTSAVFGFEIGHLRISLARILLGILLFMVLMFLTRLLQKWLREGVLDTSKMDAGISNSIDQAVGYAGIALAALLAVSYAGFDITNLAIVAGALSVGIGFGLQSIVNNFVSGLILLVERPIKVGDWIVVGDQQGNVRRISVRSTEIETFDKASLIVPNSELISGRVLNWTHRNVMGRLVIKFVLDGNADPEQVIGILLACARADPLILGAPEPMATLDQFAPTQLDFSLRVTLADITRRASVATDLRIAILKELRRTGMIVATVPAIPLAAAVPA